MKKATDKRIVGNPIRQKFHNENGISILFALLLFLVVSMVSITIITAATSSLKRANENKNTTQASMALESAAILLQNEWNNAFCKRITTEKTYPLNPGKNSKEAVVSINDDEENRQHFACEIKDMEAQIKQFEALHPNLSDGSDASIYHSTFQITSNIDEIPVINVKYELYKNKSNYEMVLTLEDEDQKEQTYMDFTISYKTKTEHDSGEDIAIDGTGSTIDISKTTETFTWKYQRTANTKDKVRSNGSD